ncbi:ABC transporter ATP-binding protein [Azospirillum picis]|uniref:Sn-glycerol 3-phosphate transport system ATP-binding protein n=1 Tax=Azospirillum picis TaxID=488438 RepID=A0ABU0MMN3_9PROT|nr:ABC transporter ATP-binding protein [Azospirillum picis]MBP2300635.1 sn-glycerol 3-phosphate transport system ATP-binding protein [Azospirillum picis]MDQ0534604.1 sn-glycerol 3-phosphate transport system ATP-binding protein [Azospirillum picis]
MSRTHSIELDRVTKRWGASPAVDSVSLTADAGQMLVLLGPSGCGKSTTLRLIAGLDTLSDGRIHIGGEDVTDLPPARRHIAMVFQSYALFPHLSVAENILFGLKVRKVPSAERQERLAWAADLLGLGRLLDRRPSQLSGGQQQRVALGRAIVAKAPVCLMDEPLSNLDAQLRHEMRREIRSLQQRLGITTVYVTHDQTEAMSMADQVVLMNAGRIEQAGPPETLYARPASSFVARFVGTPPMNLFRLPEVPDIVLGLRPEAVQLTTSEPGPRPDVGPGLEARVADTDYHGADTVVLCRFGEREEQAMAVRLPGRAGLPVGTPVRLGWAPEDLHAFDATAGHRLPDDVLDGRYRHPAAAS